MAGDPTETIIRHERSMGSEIRFILNEDEVAIRAPAGRTVLDLVRHDRRLVGTKIGCREGDCGACAILVGRLADDGRVRYRAMTSCLMPLGNAHGAHVVTIEGLNLPHGLTPVQRAMVDEGATQCGFCTVGFVVSLAGFALGASETTAAGAVAAIDGNICRCTGYKSIERAAATMAEALSEAGARDRIDWLVDHGWVPAGFAVMAERLAALAAGPSPREPASGGLRRPVGGGTDLWVQRPDEMEEASLDLLLDAPHLTGIREEGERIVLGASTTVEEMRESLLLRRLFPRLASHLKLVSSTPIRNMATLGGNLVNASPIGDLTIFLLALDAELRLASGSGERSLPLADLYLGYKRLDLAPGEIVVSISFARPGESTRLNFEKVSKRTHLDIASVNSALRLEVEDGAIVAGTLAAGGVAPVPFRLPATSAGLAGRPVAAETARWAAASALEEIAPISDVRGSSDYKRLLLRQLVFAHFVELFPDAVRVEALV